VANRRDNDTRPGRLLGEIQRAFTEALLLADEIAAESVLREAIEAGVDEATMDDAVIAPALRAVGDLWEAGELSIAEEHLATEIALRVIALQRDLHRVVRRRATTVVVLAAVEGEQHVVGLRMAGSLLIHAGYDVKQLGPSVPPQSLGVVVDRFRAHVVGLSATMASSIIAVPEAVGMVRTVRPAAGIVLGGRGVPSRFVEQPNLKLCTQVADVVAVVDALAQRASMN
jgi:MerR family transcriptional regulator, light-induced transcriptional regulator